MSRPTPADGRGPGSEVTIRSDRLRIDADLLAALADSDAVNVSTYPQRLSVATWRVDAETAGLIVGSVFVEVPTGPARERWEQLVGPGCREVAGLFVRRSWAGNGIASRLAVAAAHRIVQTGHQPVMVISATSGRMNAIADKLGGRRCEPFQAGDLALVPVVLPNRIGAR